MTTKFDYSVIQEIIAMIDDRLDVNGGYLSEAYEYARLNCPRFTTPKMWELVVGYYAPVAA